MRGKVVPLTAYQRIQRALYLAGKADADALDDYIIGAGPRCAIGYYLLHEHNGGKDPTAPDPFDRWAKQPGATVNRTADCIGGAAWCGGFDRWQEKRFAHLYAGWINTDSMLLDARGPAKCFLELSRPEPGCFVVCATGSPGHEKCGHIGTVVGVPLEWDATVRECWQALGVVDVASTGAGQRANTLRTGAGWFDTRAGFVVSTMTP